MNKTTKIHWTTECQRVFEELKTALVSAPILGFPNERDQFVPCTDVNDIGAVFSLKNRKTVKKYCICYQSAAKGSNKYSATKRELFAAVYFTSYFKEFFLGQNFQIITDHRALVWLYSSREPDAIVARRLLKLSMFNFEIERRLSPSPYFLCIRNFSLPSNLEWPQFQIHRFCI